MSTQPLIRDITVEDRLDIANALLTLAVKKLGGYMAVDRLEFCRALQNEDKAMHHETSGGDLFVSVEHI